MGGHIELLISIYSHAAVSSACAVHMGEFSSSFWASPEA